VLFDAKIVAAQTVNFFESEAANPSQRVEIKSAVMGKNRAFFVHTPADYDQQAATGYPVLYLLDGKRNLKHTIATVAMLTSKRKMPKLIIVAIPAGDSRQVDYTPTGFSTKMKNNAVGNSDKFSQFLKVDLLPYIDKNFNTAPFRILVGHSRGGLFAVNDLVAQTGMFQAHFVFSPALWVDDYKIIAQLTTLLEQGELNKGFLFATAGGRENQNILNSVSKLSRALGVYDGSDFKWDSQITADDSHATAPFVGTYLALRRLYANWDVPSAHIKHGLKAYLTQYQLLSTAFGYRIIPPEYRLRYMGANLYFKNSFVEAEKVFAQNLKFYPNSAMAHDNLAESLEAQGLFVKAMLQMNKAMNLLNTATEADKQAIAEHYQKLKKKMSADN
jgi:predicted alpha/beta superfamily hydrolase